MRSKPTILVVGATGKTGAAVVSALRAADWPVRAVVRKDDLRSERLRALGAATVVADLFDPAQLLDAMRGTSRAYYLPVFHPFAIQGATAFVDAAREARLECIVQMSQWLSSPDHPSFFTRQIWLIDRLFASLPGIAHTVVDPGFFADNYLRVIDYAALLGIFPMLTGDSLNAPPSNEDIGRVAAALLMDPSRHAGRSYRPTGPTLLSARDVVPILRRVLGRRVTGIDMPWWMFVRAARLQGESMFTLENYRHYVADHRQGAFERGAPNDVVLELTGRPPEDMETIARRYAAMPFARRTPANRLRALWNFSRVPFVSGVAGDRIARDRGDPVPSHPRAAMENDRWTDSHPSGRGSSPLRGHPATSQIGVFGASTHRVGTLPAIPTGLHTS